MSELHFEHRSHSWAPSAASASTAAKRDLSCWPCMPSDSLHPLMPQGMQPWHGRTCRNMLTPCSVFYLEFSSGDGWPQMLNRWQAACPVQVSACCLRWTILVQHANEGKEQCPQTSACQSMGLQNPKAQHHWAAVGSNAPVLSCRARTSPQAGHMILAAECCPDTLQMLLQQLGSRACSNDEVSSILTHLLHTLPHLHSRTPSFRLLQCCQAVGAGEHPKAAAPPSPWSDQCKDCMQQPDDASTIAIEVRASGQV